MNEKKVIVIGGGVSGISFGYLLKRLYGNTSDFLIIERGNQIEKRKCEVIENGKCGNCNICNIVSGSGGGGFYSDGKVIENSGWYEKDFNSEEIEEANTFLKKEILSLYPNYLVFDPENYKSNKIENIISLVKSLGFEISLRKVYWYGSEEIRNLSKKLESYVKDRIVYNSNVEKITKEGRRYKLTLSFENNKHEIYTQNVIIATGRYFDWTNLFKDSNILVEYLISKPHVGVRVEVEGNPFEHLTSIFYDVKLYKYNLRTFCFNPYGVVIQEKHPSGEVSVNGLSFRYKKYNYTNFAIIGPDIPYIRTYNPLYIPMDEIDGTFGGIEKGTLKNSIYEKRLMEILPSKLVDFLRDLQNIANYKLKGVLYYPEIKLNVRIPKTKRFKYPEENIYFIGESTGRLVGIWASIISSILLLKDFENIRIFS